MWTNIFNAPNVFIFISIKNKRLIINFLEKYLANFVNDIEYKRITKKLKEYDLMADVDDQRFHHFCS